MVKVGQNKRSSFGFVLLKIFVTIVYLISPIDVVPDVIPILGFFDDVALIIWMWSLKQSSASAGWQKIKGRMFK